MYGLAIFFSLKYLIIFKIWLYVVGMKRYFLKSILKKVIVRISKRDKKLILIKMKISSHYFPTKFLKKLKHCENVVLFKNMK